MFDLFFDRNSRFVRAVEALGVGLLIVNTILGRIWTLGLFSKVLFFLSAGFYVFLRFCHTWNWYRKFELPADVDATDIGIRIQLKKAMVPTSYLILIINLAVFFKYAFGVLLTASVILAVTAYVNLVLVYLHLKDDDGTPPSFFSRLSKT
jgi:hypothetical protein